MSRPVGNSAGGHPDPSFFEHTVQMIIASDQFPRYSGASTDLSARAKGIGTALALLFLIGAQAAPVSAQTRPMNDSGVQYCAGVEAEDRGACGKQHLPGQDALYGRDLAAAEGRLTKQGAGRAGFDYSKISNSGAVLAPEAALGPGPDDWACTRDNVTGLVWEVKVNDPGNLRHWDHTFTWFRSTSPDGNPGNPGRARTCRSLLSNCNTDRYVEAINATGLCGATGWRIPSVNELESLIDYGQANPAIDQDYFPNTHPLAFWTSDTVAQGFSHTWVVDFTDGFTGFIYRFFESPIRVVREDTR